MVTDNPFTEPVIPLRDLPPRETASPSPILRTYSEGDIHRPAVTDGTNSPESHPAPDAIKTPRRVQWTQDHVVNLAPLGDDPDAQIVDHSNIRDVNDALEKYRKRRQHPAGQSSLSISSMASSEDGQEGDHHRHPFSPSLHHEPRRDQDLSEEDYDYRLDQDPVASDEDVDGKDLERTEENILDHGANNHMAAYVPLGETDGLPSLPNQDEPSAKEEAAKLVRNHTSKWGTLRRRVRSGAMKREDERRDQDERKLNRIEHGSGPQGEREKNGTASLNPPLNAPLNPPPGSGLPHIPGGTSVLGTLLTLYNQQMMDSTHTTPASSIAPSRASSFDESMDEDRPHGSSWSEKHLPWRRSSHNDDFGPHKRNESYSSVADRPHSPQTPGLKGTWSRAVDRVRDARDDRPKAARSGAGVFGALVGSTGAVAAAAAPVSSTLIPRANKPGYHLRRYQLGGEESPRPSHSSSTPNTRPSSPHSHEHSPLEKEHKDGREKRSAETLVSVEGARSKSTDNLLEMKSRKSRPVSLNLNFPKGAEKFIRPLTHTPDREMTGDSYFKMSEDERRRKEWEAEKRKRKKAKEARKKQEVFIIQHVATIIARQHFIMKLARALMMFGSPSHRLETQIQATAKVLEINAQVVYLPGTMLLSFADDATHTSETKFMKQDTGLDLGRLLKVHNVYWDVVHDKVSVEDANKELDVLMTAKPHYRAWQTILIGGLCSSFISVPSFSASFVDALMCAPLGMLLVSVQLLAAKNDMFSNVFEITIATLISFLAAVLGATDKFCYTALVSGGIVLVLPGYIVLTGALEIASRNITAGSVRIAYSVMYSLFLGFGISIGAEIYSKIIGKSVANADDYTCNNTHAGAPWYMQTPSGYWYYLCVPGYSLVLSLRNQQPLLNKELPIMVAIASAGWVTNHFSAKAFPDRSDIISAIGSFCVGILGNLYGRFCSNGASFPVMVTGILFQLPSGLSAGGLFTFAKEGTSGSANQYSQGFGVAQQLVSVAIGLTVGLFVSAAIMYPLGGSRRRGAGIFSF